MFCGTLSSHIPIVDLSNYHCCFTLRYCSFCCS
jgi:hypothetical protein